MPVTVHPAPANGTSAAPDAPVRTVLGLDDLVVYDTFNRDDGPLGTSDSGHTWTALSGEWSILDNRVKEASGVTAVMVVESGVAHAEVGADVRLSAAGGGMRVVGRAIDADNFLFISVNLAEVVVGKFDAGTSTVLASDATFVGKVSRMYRTRMLMRDNTVSVFVDGKERLSYTLATAENTKYGAASLHGFSNNSRDHRWDNFYVRRLTY